MNKSLEYARRHPDEARAILPEFTQIPPELIDEMALPIWSSEITRPTIVELSRLSQKYGLINEPPDLEQLIRKPSS
jgi:NitT/TauT family transport system substrate-binding protein